MLCSMDNATFIPLTSAPGATLDLSALLAMGRELVARTEPGTLHWYALAREDQPGELAIFDTFVDPAGRAAHFGGQVAAALRDRAPQLVEGGWERGVLARVANFRILAAKVPGAADEVPPITKATLVRLRAAVGQAEALADLLVAGRDVVAQTEPGTLHWLGLRSEIDPDEFAIFDLFADASGRAEHFAGRVAATLKACAGELVDRGWDEGVLARAVHYDVQAAK